MRPAVLCSESLMDAERLQVGLLVVDEDPRASLEIAEAADRSSLDSLWTLEHHNRNSITRLAAFAARTERIVLGSNVSLAFARAPLITASAAAEIHELSGGRFVLGLGTSRARGDEDWYGIPYDHPAPRLAEVTTLI